MGSLSPVLSGNGTPISPTSIDAFTSTIKGEVLVKGLADQAAYAAAIARFNRATISEAVSPYSRTLQLLKLQMNDQSNVDEFVIPRLSSYLSMERKMSQRH